MYREINIEKIKTLEKDLYNTILEIRASVAIEEEVFAGGFERDILPPVSVTKESIIEKT